MAAGRLVLWPTVPRTGRSGIERGQCAGPGIWRGLRAYHSPDGLLRKRIQGLLQVALPVDFERDESANHRIQHTLLDRKGSA